MFTFLVVCVNFLFLWNFCWFLCIKKEPRFGVLWKLFNLFCWFVCWINFDKTTIDNAFAFCKWNAEKNCKHKWNQNHNAHVKNKHWKWCKCAWFDKKNFESACENFKNCCKACWNCKNAETCIGVWCFNESCVWFLCVKEKCKRKNVKNKSKEHICNNNSCKCFIKSKIIVNIHENIKSNIKHKFEPCWCWKVLFCFNKHEQNIKTNQNSNKNKCNNIVEIFSFKACWCQHIKQAKKKESAMHKAKSKKTIKHNGHKFVCFNFFFHYYSHLYYDTILTGRIRNK